MRCNFTLVMLHPSGSVEDANNSPTLGHLRHTLPHHVLSKTTARTFYVINLVIKDPQISSPSSKLCSATSRFCSAIILYHSHQNAFESR